MTGAHSERCDNSELVNNGNEKLASDAAGGLDNLEKYLFYRWTGYPVPADGSGQIFYIKMGKVQLESCLLIID